MQRERNRLNAANDRAVTAGADETVGGDLWIALGWCVGILVAAYVFVMITYRRRTS